ncbi:MAG TPA: acetyl-CoA decarbonylase/synthase complex subunit gamma [Anaerolineales bacterium]|nr:acetyl-CoA decarbonylase/synthase complex subunit gamma [Anaerolineales bacterium]
MPLTGLEIYKLLPQTNCKECGFPTCLAFAMKLAAKQAELKACPYVTEESKNKLEAASAPPIRLVRLGSDAAKIEVGNETVLFRHEKTFFHRPGLFLHVKDTEDLDALKARVTEADAYRADYVGISLGLDGFAVEAASGDPAKYKAAVAAVAGASQKPIILMAPTPDLAKAGLEACADRQPLIHAATPDNWQAMAEVAKAAKVPLALRAESLEALADLTPQLVKAGLEDLVLDPMVAAHRDSLHNLTHMRRLALKKTFRPLGYPVITFPGAGGKADEVLLAAQHIAKYGALVVLESFDPASLYPLLVLRQNIYTDPQKPIQVQPGVYEINTPDAKAPILVTTNFSITYFAVANEVEGSGWPAWLVVTDAEGMSVLTAWAAGKFDAERIGKAVKGTGVGEKVGHKRVIIPGQVAVLSGELEEELPGWQIMVGPREAVDIGGFLKAMWPNGH